MARISRTIAAIMRSSVQSSSAVSSTISATVEARTRRPASVFARMAAISFHERPFHLHDLVDRFVRRMYPGRFVGRPAVVELRFRSKFDFDNPSPLLGHHIQIPRRRRNRNRWISFWGEERIAPRIG